MEIELLPCPFCGGKPEMVSELFLGRKFFHVRCTRCACMTLSDLDEEGASFVWNRRTE